MFRDIEIQSYQEGIFKPFFIDFIQFKRSKGEKVAHSALVRMKYLNDTLNNYGTLEVSRQTVEEILAPKTGVSEFTRYARITYLRQFLAFLSTVGIQCYQLPRRYARVPSCQFRPYIFSDSEIVRLVGAADNLSKKRSRVKSAGIYPLLIRILISTGMRISEVLSLRYSDIDFSSGVITVVNSKNGVSRYLPASDSLISTIKECKTVDGSEGLLFCSWQTGQVYSYETVRRNFGELCRAASIFKTDGSTPNIHSLRHTFCTKSLEQMLSAGMDVYTAVPILAAYVGHSNYHDTEQYIHFTEGNYHSYFAKTASLRKLIPEVKDGGGHA